MCRQDEEGNGEGRRRSLSLLPLHESCPLNDVEIWTTLSHIHACAHCAPAPRPPLRSLARSYSLACMQNLCDVSYRHYLTTFAATTNRQRPPREEGGTEGGMYDKSQRRADRGKFKEFLSHVRFASAKSLLLPRQRIFLSVG